MKITFYRSATNANQQAYKSPLFSVMIPDTVQKEKAIAAAIQQFQEHMKVTRWQELAEFYEVG